MTQSTKYPSHPLCIKCNHKKKKKREEYKKHYASHSPTRGKYAKEIIK